MSNIKFSVTKPNYNDSPDWLKEYDEFLKSEDTADLIIYQIPEELIKEVFDKTELNVVAYEHGPYGDGGWNLLEILFHEVTKIYQENQSFIWTYVATKSLDKLGSIIATSLAKLRAKSELKRFKIFLAKSKDNYSTFTLNSYLTAKEAEEALKKMISAHEQYSSGNYIYEGRDKKWVDE